MTLPLYEAKVPGQPLGCKTFPNLKPNASVRALCRIILQHLSDGAVLAGKCSRNTVAGSPRKAIGIETPGLTERTA